MDTDGNCGGGAECEKVCPFKMIGRVCPDTDDIAYVLNVAYGIIDPRTRGVPVAA